MSGDVRGTLYLVNWGVIVTRMGWVPGGEGGEKAPACVPMHRASSPQHPALPRLQKQVAADSTPHRLREARPVLSEDGHGRKGPGTAPELTVIASSPAGTVEVTSQCRLARTAPHHENHSPVQQFRKVVCICLVT